MLSTEKLLVKSVDCIYKMDIATITSKLAQHYLSNTASSQMFYSLLSLIFKTNCDKQAILMHR